MEKSKDKDQKIIIDGCEVKGITKEEPIKWDCIIREPRLQFIEALAKAQLEMKPVEKTGKNPFYKSTYAPYEEVWASVGKPLNENGFAVIHQTRIEDGHFLIITRLIHKEGHEEYSEHQVPNQTSNMQDLGKAETYGKRYNLVALTAVPVGGEDDDGNTAMKIGKEAKDKAETKESLVKQIEELTLEMPVERVVAFEEWLKKEYKCTHVSQLDIVSLKKVLLKVEEVKRQIQSKGV